MTPPEVDIPNSQLRLALCLLFLACLLLSGISSSFAEFGNASENRQVRIGLRIFKAVLAADKDLSLKTNGDESLEIALLYTSHSDKANKFGKELLAMGKSEKRGNIRGKRIDVKPIHIEKLHTLIRQPAALFIIDPLNQDQLKRVIDFAKTHRRLLYSPFQGDVERGVMAGLAIETRVRPHINQASLEASSVNLRSFFFKVAKIYEP